VADPCRSGNCPGQIDFALSVPQDGERPSRMPVDHASADRPGGNLAVWRDQGGVLRFRVLRAGETPGRGEHLGLSHFASCAEPGVWRRRTGG
jgi:hypothetical protein